LKDLTAQLEEISNSPSLDALEAQRVALLGKIGAITAH
jgi:hypothetical protein